MHSRLQFVSSVIVLQCVLSGGVGPAPGCYHEVSSTLSHVGVRDLHWSERFGMILQCGGETFLLHRRESSDETGRGWETVARREEADGSYASPFVIIPQGMHMSHNAAFICVRDKILAFGGQKSDHKTLGDSRPGIMRREAHTRQDMPWQWSDADIVLDGHARSGCVEERLSFRSCEFDGKLSLVYYQGSLLLYARANVDEKRGGRHVQVTKSQDGGYTWSNWTLVKMKKYQTKSSNNIYFFSVHQVYSKLVALFPAVIGGAGGVYISFSEDGIRWEQPSKLVDSHIVDADWRTTDYPLHALESVNQTFSVLIHHNVGLNRNTGTPYVCRYDLPFKTLGPQYDLPIGKPERLAKDETLGVKHTDQSHQTSAVHGASCGAYAQVGVAHCIVGDARAFVHEQCHMSMRTNLLHALGPSAGIFMVLAIGGCHGNAQREHCDRDNAASLADLAKALASVNATQIDLQYHSESLVAPGHRCVWGSGRPSSGYFQWAKVEKCFEMVQSYENNHCIRFSHVVRSRPDLIFKERVPQIDAYLSGHIHVGTVVGSSAWLDDRFAIVPRDLASVYFSTVRSYSTCRKVTAYQKQCDLFRAVGVDHPDYAKTEKVLEGIADRQHHVGSECLLGIWLREHHVPWRAHPFRLIHGAQASKEISDASAEKEL